MEKQISKTIIESIASDTLKVQYSINKIANDYINRPIPLTNGQFFQDKKWFIFNGLDKPIMLDFETYVLPDGTRIGADENWGLELFLRVRTLHILESESNINGQPLAAKTIVRHFRNARAVIIPALKKNLILCNDPDTDSFHTLTNLTPTIFELLLDEILESNRGKNSKWEIVESILKYLSCDVAIPRSFCPVFNLCGNLTYDSVVGSLEDETKAFEPIPESDYFLIGKSALEFVRDYSDEIIKLHEATAQTLQLDPPDSIKSAFNNSKNKNRSSARSAHITKWRNKELIRRLNACGIKLPSFSDQHQSFWNVEKTGFLENNSIDCSEHILTLTHCYYLFDLLFGALCILILLPTGMRNSELRFADFDRVSKDANQDGIYSYINSIKKIRAACSYFQSNNIPIPVETWRAFNLLELLTRCIRPIDSSFICIRPLNFQYSSVFETDEFGTIIKMNAPLTGEDSNNRAISKFCRFIRSQTIPTTHRFRPSIAEFMLRKTSLAPILICQLFGHLHLAMTLRYLKRNSLIRREIRKYNAERFKDGAIVMAIAFSNSAVGGRMVERIHNAVIAREEFQGLSQPEMAIALVHWLMNRIVNQQLIILQTPICLCCRSTTAKTIPPCLSISSEASETILPDPSNCSGVNCDWALVTFEQIGELKETLIFYKNILQSNDPLSFRNTHLLSLASDFVETYDPIVDRIKQVPIKELRIQVEELKRNMLGMSA